MLPICHSDVFGHFYKLIMLIAVCFPAVLNPSLEVGSL
jgi:hypothetical protein